jgi:hypothetical protein
LRHALKVLRIASGSGTSKRLSESSGYRNLEPYLDSCSEFLQELCESIDV